MYYIVLLPVNHWKFDIPLIATEKKSFNIYLVLLSLPLQGRKFWTLDEYVGIETVVKPYSPAWQFCTTGITSCKGPIIGEFMQGRVEVKTLGTRMDNEPGSFHDKTLGRRKET